MYKKIVALGIMAILGFVIFVPFGNLPQLIVDIRSCPYDTSDYILNEYDCSNMCAELHDHLESKGYNITYCTGFNGMSGHAWLETNKGVIIESTQKFIDISIFYDYNIKHRYDTPEEYSTSEREIGYK